MSSVFACMFKLRPYLLLLLAASLPFSACKQVSRLVPVVPDRSINQVITSMHTAQPPYDFFTARYSGRAVLNGDVNDVAGSIFIRKDSAILISVAPVLGIEVARILITPTNVKMLNRLEGTYFDGDMSLINSMLNADIDFYMLQSFLLGADFPHFSAENFRLSHEEENIKLYNPARKRLRPTAGATAAAPGAIINHSLWLDPQSYRIIQSNVSENEGRRTMQASYPGFTPVQGHPFPSEVQLAFLDDTAQAALTLRYSRITLNQPQQITFNIPSRYTPMDF